jgi:1,2-dihydroxy-3-keto-5-methylthiopentene dioxygenase
MKCNEKRRRIDMSRLPVFADHDPATVRLETHHPDRIAEQLQRIGVQFERWQPSQAMAPGTAAEQVLAAYRADIDRLIAARGFRSVDVVSVSPQHPERATMRAKFLAEHAHREDEVRFFVAGSGQFALHVEDQVYEVVCEQGDLIGVPDGALHWFDMGAEPDFVAIRFFSVPEGWVGHFSGSDIAQRFPAYEPQRQA